MRPMNDNDPSGLHERELPEWLQRETDRIEADYARDRLWLGLTTFAIIVITVAALNAWLSTQGYGA